MGGFRDRVTLREDEVIDVMIDGHRRGAVRVGDLFPPP
jgi:hypothetical protein